MRHRRAGNHLSRTTSHRDALLRNLAAALIVHERIRTTLPKAKTLRPFVERLITLARRAAKLSKDDPVQRARALHLRRTAFARLRNSEALARLFDVVGPRLSGRAGGYTRILKLAPLRLGDGGEQALIELVEREKVETEPTGVAEAEAAEPAKKTRKAAVAAGA
jgi:large subunit ribosomal protein L17